MKPNPNCEKCSGHGVYVVHGYYQPDVVDCECTDIPKWIIVSVMIVAMVVFFFLA